MNCLEAELSIHQTGQGLGVQKDRHTHYSRYTKQQMDLEIQRVAREMYKAFSGMNEEFEDVSMHN